MNARQRSGDGAESRAAESGAAPLPIRTLPVIEQWDCTGCGKCCRGNVVPLSADDLRKIRAQNWGRHPDFQGVKATVRQGLLSSRRQLAQRDDGTCVFLSADGLCQIHKEHGYDAKPLVCRMYPLQLVPVGRQALLTLRRSCPTAAAGQGRELAAHRDQAQKFVAERPGLAQFVLPPPLVGSHRRSWPVTQAVTGSLQGLLTDPRFPLVRRLTHVLAFLHLLEQCRRLRKLSDQKLGELAPLLAEKSPLEAAPWFREPAAPRGAALALFRQSVLEYLRLHPRYTIRERFLERTKLMAASMSFARGRGPIPRIHASFPETTYQAVASRELGVMAPDVYRPLIDYFEAAGHSLQYAVASRPGWSLIDKTRALVLGYSSLMWMLRYFSEGRSPTVAEMVDLITALDRGQGFASLCGRQHRRRVRLLASSGLLSQLTVWHSR